MLETRLDVRVLLENAVHVRGFLADLAIWSYIRADFQHELARLLETGLDVRLREGGCWKAGLMYDLLGASGKRPRACARGRWLTSALL